jgi:integration host factor subunit beta
MVKSDIAAALVQKRSLAPEQAQQIVEVIFASMREALSQREEIEIRGFGAFRVRHYHGHRGRNPRTGGVIVIGPKNGVLFRTGKELRQLVDRHHESRGPKKRP